MLYTEGMSTSPSAKRKSPTTLTLKLGDWLEANATGWGVAAIPLVILVLVGAAVAVEVGWR
jgi:hypothetical protein